MPQAWESAQDGPVFPHHDRLVVAQRDDRAGRESGKVAAIPPEGPVGGAEDEQIIKVQLKDGVKIEGSSKIQASYIGDQGVT
ncbi:hypothetical protein ABT382_35110, partial [Streptomyces pharetrae]|uniref:hypothetical protein n=1 Tax=Streptomyces pharetrae TaxID=291370 RepID=UPI003347473B